MKEKYLISVLGPTAVGKTNLALYLARKLGTVILSADSRQMYRGMDIGTAKPTPAELREIRHYFIDTLAPGASYSAGMFETEAISLLRELFIPHSAVLMAGGSGLYLDAVWSGIPDMPEIPAEVRQEVTRDLEENGLESLRHELKEKDPAYFSEVDLDNRQRVVRALEVIRHTGQAFSVFRRQALPERPFHNLKVGLEMPREELYARIEKRVDLMMEQGLTEEVGKLTSYRHHNALQTVGYKEIFDYLDGAITQDEAVSLIKRNTRRYAKRQLTWFRRYDDIKWFHPEDYQGVYRYVTKSMQQG